MVVTLNELFSGVVQEGALQPSLNGFPVAPTPEQSLAITHINATLTNLISSYRLFFMMTTGTFQIDAGVRKYSEQAMALPFFDLSSVAHNAYTLSGIDRVLQYVDYQDMDTFGVTPSTGEPSYYTIEGNQFVLSHIPTVPYTCSVRYYQQYIGTDASDTKLTALSAATDKMALPDRWKQYVILEAASRTYRAVNAGDSKYGSLLQLAKKELDANLNYMKPSGRDTVTQIVPAYQLLNRPPFYPFGTPYQ
jgi:hypothetical protein